MKNYLSFVFMICVFLGYTQNQKEYNIGVLVDQKAPRLTPLLMRLHEEIKAVVGEDAKINFPQESFLSNNLDINLAKHNYQKLIENNTDIILAFGILNNKIINAQEVYKKPTILFGAVNRDFEDIDYSNETSGITNFTYLIQPASFKEDFIKLKELTKFKKLGIIIEEEAIAVLPFKEKFDTAFKELNGTYKLISYKTLEDISSNLDGVDAVYLAGGFFLTKEEVKTLADILIEKKIPSLTINGIDQVEEGIMATNQPEESLEQFFRRIALSIEAYVNGTPLADLSVFINTEPRLTVNYNTAKSIGVPLKYSLITNTDFIGGFENIPAGKSYNLIKAIEQALDKNLSLQSGRKDIDISGQDVKTAKSEYLPSVTATAGGRYTDPELAEVSNGQQPEFQTTGSVSLEQTIFAEGVNANISVQKSLLKARQEDFNAQQLNTIFDVANAYFNTLILKSNAKIQLRNLNLTKKNLLLAEQNFETGESSKSDVLRFRSQKAQNTQSMIEAANQLNQSLISLNQLMNNPVNTEIVIEDVALNDEVFKDYNYDEMARLLDDPRLREPFIEFLIEEALSNAPELKSLGYNLEATERNIKLNGYGRFLPTVALQGTYNRTFSRSGKGSSAPANFPELLNSNYNVGVNVSLPIFNKTQTNIRRQTAIIQKEQLGINKENTELGIKANIRTNVFNVVNQISNIELSKVSEDTAKESLELTQVSYSNGAVNVTQLIDAQNNYLNAQLARTNATYNYLINVLSIERLLNHYFLLSTKEENDKFIQRFLEYTNKNN
ncbi:TolC family protein [Aquimarina rhabdastrellae]